MRFVKNVLRDLKRRYGLPVDVYNIASSSTSDTGITTRSLAKKSIRRALVLETKNLQMAVKNLLNDLPIGGLFDISERYIIVDRADLGDFKIVPGDYVIFSRRKFEIKQVSEIEQTASYVVYVKETTNDVFNQIVDIGVYQFVGTNQEVTHD